MNGYGESLWDDDFQGYLTSETRINPGDILIVVIETSFSLSHISTQKDSKTISFEYTGGEYSNLFSFLPDITSNTDNSSKGDETYTLTTDMVARVVSVEENYAYIKGSREIMIDGKKESVTISGYINALDIDQQKRVLFSRIADSSLVFETFLYPSDPILTEDDIVEIITPLEEEISGEVPLPEETESVAEATAESETMTVPEQPPKAATGLSQEKKKELFLRYLNRMIDLLFN